MVRRSDTLRTNVFQQCVWSEAVWGGKQLPMLRTKFPNLKLSKQFGGSNEHLLKLFTAKESILKSLLKFRKNGLTTKTHGYEATTRESIMEFSHPWAIPFSNNAENYSNSESTDHLDICTISMNSASMVPMVPLLELSSIPEFYTEETDDISNSCS